MAYSNLDAHEGNTIDQTVIALDRRSRQLQIMNDSFTADLKYRFNESHRWATLKPTEVISMDIWVKTVYLSGFNIDYRIWSYG